MYCVYCTHWQTISIGSILGAKFYNKNDIYSLKSAVSLSGTVNLAVHISIHFRIILGTFIRAPSAVVSFSKNYERS